MIWFKVNVNSDRFEVEVNSYGKFRHRTAKKKWRYEFPHEILAYYPAPKQRNMEDKSESSSL